MSWQLSPRPVKLKWDTYSFQPLSAMLNHTMLVGMVVTPATNDLP